MFSLESLQDIDTVPYVPYVLSIPGLQPRSVVSNIPITTWYGGLDLWIQLTIISFVLKCLPLEGTLCVRSNVIVDMNAPE